VALIEVRELSKTYVMGGEPVRALRKLTVDIERGELVAVMGPSGSGKSTFMNLVGCLDRPTKGNYRLDGVDVATQTIDGLAALRNRKIGFVFQSFNLLPRATALANVELPMVYAGADRAKRRARATEALTMIGLGERLHHLPTQLSGGQQQRVAIARALVNDPVLILADEPTGALDSVSTEDVMKLLVELNEAGRTVVLITHEDDVASYATRVVRLDDGRITSDTPHRRGVRL
jgi:putative ABC transport system ATP-binding protein